MQQSGIKTGKEYVKLLLKNKNEIGLLFIDLFINVTRFFGKLLSKKNKYQVNCSPRYYLNSEFKKLDKKTL